MYVTDRTEKTIIDKMVTENAVTENVVAEVFDFQIDKSNYNLKLYFAVMKSVGITKSVDEMYEDYQRIYDKSVERETRKEIKELAER